MKKTVMVFGVFDILHLGHIDMMKQAKSYGDNLIAVVARDENVKKIKKRDAYNVETDRRKLLEELKIVDKAVLGDPENPYKVVVEFKPDVIALGYDQKIFVDKLIEELENNSIDSEIVRLRPFSEETYKSGRARYYISKN